MPKRRPIARLISGGKEYPFKLLSARAKKAALRPLTAELGYLAIAWNQLHHNLSLLFTLLVRSTDQFVANAVWYSTDSDFTQRKMLRAVVELDEKVPGISKRLPALQRDEILWILDQIDDPLRHKRNNALHSPLVMMHAVVDGEVKSWVEAHLIHKIPERDRYAARI